MGRDLGILKPQVSSGVRRWTERGGVSTHSLPLLHHMRQLVRQQMATGLCAGCETSRCKHDIHPHRVRMAFTARADSAAARITVHAHLAEIVPEARLHESTCAGIERLAGGLQDVVDHRRRSVYGRSARRLALQYRFIVFLLCSPGSLSLYSSPSRPAACSRRKGWAGSVAARPSAVCAPSHGIFLDHRVQVRARRVFCSARLGSRVLSLLLQILRRAGWILHACPELGLIGGDAALSGRGISPRRSGRASCHRSPFDACSANLNVIIASVGLSTGPL